jgi:hypothetical protein
METAVRRRTLNRGARALRRGFGGAAALLLAACASVPSAPPAEDQAGPARAADDAALAAAAAADLAPLEDHFVAIAGGEFLGGSMLREDATRLFDGRAGAALHAYFFIQGSQGDRRVSLPALYGPRVAGSALLQALGLQAAFDPGEGLLTLSRGGTSRSYRTGGGPAAAAFIVEAASGLGEPLRVDLVVASGFAGTALVSAADAEAAGLHRSEIPGAATVAELMTGRTGAYRRALARVSLADPEGRPDSSVAALVEVLFPR